MPDLRSYLKQEVPRDIACQIRSGIRFVWPHLNAGWTKLWTAPPGYPADRRTFVLMDDELVMSHVEVNFRELEHVGVRYQVGGVSAVFTYPNYRGSGAGERVVIAATEFLKQSEIDFALLFCGERVKSLYLRAGWEHWLTPVISFGEATAPRLYRDDSPSAFVMGLEVSGRARKLREQREGRPLYVGVGTW